MYLPEHFRDARPDALAQAVAASPLGLLVTHGPGGLDANPIPWLYDAGEDAGGGALGTLRGHVARANPLWQPGASDAQALVVFSGEQGYISPSWYPSKAATHRQVPTWNYAVVHAHGALAVQDDKRFVRRVVAQLTCRHEATEPVPWKMGDSAPEFIDSMLRNIVGIQITLTSLVGKVKLSQNREERDRLGAADTLDARGHTALAHAMRKAV